MIDAKPGSADKASADKASADKASEHKASLMEKAPTFSNDFGSIRRMDNSDLPVMARLSLRRLVLAPLGVREPHWHANAHELGYCLRGEHLVTIAGSHSAYDSFTITKGQMFFVPSGALHHIENTGAEEGEIILAFSSERVEDFGLSGVFGCFTDAVLGNTTGLPAEAFSGLKRTPEDTYIGGRKARAVADAEEKHINRYKYDLEAAAAPIDSAAGSAHTAEAGVWPVLDKLSMFSVRITDQGMRELHWHPETAEMGYVTAGVGRMTIVSPNGVTDTYEMKAGDVYFIPRAYPHHIENIGAAVLHILIFFDQKAPEDVGGKSLVSMFSPEVMAATFKTDVAAIPKFEFTAEDPLIVPRINPVDGPVDGPAD
jgi:oxalate decarboxylase